MGSVEPRLLLRHARGVWRVARPILTWMRKMALAFVPRPKAPFLWFAVNLWMLLSGQSCDLYRGLKD